MIYFKTSFPKVLSKVEWSVIVQERNDSYFMSTEVNKG